MLQLRSPYTDSNDIILFIPLSYPLCDVIASSAIDSHRPDSIVPTQSLILLFLFSHIRPMPRLATLPLAGVPFRTPGTKRRRRASFAISSDDT